MREELSTARLVLRRFAPEDWRDLHEYLSQADVLLYEPLEPQDEAQCQEIARKWASGDSFWAVSLKDGGKMVGHVYFAQKEPPEWRTWELGYVLNPQFQGMGYATEACRALMKKAFLELGAHRVVAMCDTLNVASWHLLERLQMRREAHFVKNGSFRQDAEGRPVWHDSYAYGILADEWNPEEVSSHSDRRRKRTHKRSKGN